jgi:hypothetical protein
MHGILLPLAVCGLLGHCTVAWIGIFGGAKPSGAKGPGIAQSSEHMSQTPQHRTQQDARLSQPGHVPNSRRCGEAVSQCAERWHRAAAKMMCSRYGRFFFISSPDLLGATWDFRDPWWNCSCIVEDAYGHDGCQTRRSDRTWSIWSYFD